MSISAAASVAAADAAHDDDDPTDQQKSHLNKRAETSRLHKRNWTGSRCELRNKQTKPKARELMMIVALPLPPPPSRHPSYSMPIDAAYSAADAGQPAYKNSNKLYDDQSGWEETLSLSLIIPDRAKVVASNLRAARRAKHATRPAHGKMMAKLLRGQNESSFRVFATRLNRQNSRPSLFVCSPRRIERPFKCERTNLNRLYVCLLSSVASNLWFVCSPSVAVAQRTPRN